MDHFIADCGDWIEALEPDISYEFKESAAERWVRKEIDRIAVKKRTGDVDESFNCLLFPTGLICSEQVLGTRAP